ncbi:MAG: hypothetical protein WCD76_12200 [Pyrinomonadaceae bacterium]
MNDLDRRRYEMFLNVREFGAAQAVTFPPASYGGGLFNALDADITTLDKHASDQVTGFSSAKQSTTSKASVRDELRRDLEAISRTARAMASSQPGVEDKFRVQRKFTDQSLLSTARSFAVEAVMFKAEFVKRGLPADFIEDLKADIAAFESAITGKIQGRGTHVAATAAIEDSVEHGMGIVRELDALVRNVFATDHATLAAWLSAKHVARTPRASPTQTGQPAPPDAH